MSAKTLNPTADTDKDVLTNVDGLDGYDDKDFLPDDTSFNNHYPFQDSVSDFLIYSLGDFDKLYEVSDYNADDGSIGVSLVGWLRRRKSI